MLSHSLSAVVIVALASSGLAAGAGPASTWNAPVPLSRAGAGARMPDVAAAGNGDAVVVWRQHNPAGDRVVASWRFDHEAWSSPQALSHGVGGHSGPQVAMNARRAVVVWRSASGRVMVRQHRAAGWTRPIAVSGTSQVLSDLDVAIDPRGDITVVWSRVESSGGVHRFVVRASRKLAGRHWGAATRLSGPVRPGHEDGHPVVAMGGNGEAVVLWMRSPYESDDAPIMISRILRTSDHWRHRRALSVTQGYGLPLIAMNRRGDAAASWTGSPFEGVRPYALTGFRPSAGIWHIKHMRPRLGGSTSRGVAIDTDGTVAVTWESYRRSTGSAIQVARRPVGGPWDPPEIVSEQGTLTVDPRIAMGEHGDSTVVWRRLSDTDDIMAARRPQAGAWETPQSLSMGMQLPNQGAPPVAMDAVGHTVVAWVMRDAGTNWVMVSTD